MKLKTKLLSGFMIIASLSLVVSAVSYWGLQTTRTQYDLLANQTMRSAIYLKEIQYNFTGQANDERGYQLTRDLSYKDELVAKSAKIDTLVQSLEPLMFTDEEKQLLQKIKDTHTAFTDINLQVIAQGELKNDTEMHRLSFQVGRDTRKALSASFDELSAIKRVEMTDLQTKINQLSQQLNIMNIILIIFVFGLASLLGFILSRRIFKSIKNVTSLMEQLANGNLAVEELPVISKDEIGSLSEHTNIMLRKLKELVLNIKSQAEQVTASSQELSATMEQNENSVNQVSTSIIDIASDLSNQNNLFKESSNLSLHLAENIQQMMIDSTSANDLAHETNKSAQEGSVTIQEAVHQMNQIEESTKSLESIIQKLAANSREINGFVGAISTIAEQTNLLSLNASIEAARAGEQGRGFAVVADEVRKLADQSQTSAKQITALVHETEMNISQAVSLMTNEVQNVSDGITTVSKAGDKFNQINTLIRDLAHSVDTMSEAVVNSTQTNQQIQDSIQNLSEFSCDIMNKSEEVSQITEEQLTSTKEITQLSLSLAQISEGLFHSTERFEI